MEDTRPSGAWSASALDRDELAGLGESGFLMRDGGEEERRERWRNEEDRKEGRIKLVEEELAF